MTTEVLCELCKVTCTLVCASCNKVAYCSREHQKKDWKRHKKECFPAQIVSDSIRGRHLTATRDIHAGEIIFKETPLVTGPSGKTRAYPICLSCFKIPLSNYKCSKCNWPLCNKICEETRTHRDFECGIFRDKKIECFSADEVILYENITILRGLLMKKFGKETEWRKILDLESHQQMKKESYKIKKLTPEFFIRDACGLREFEEKEIAHVSGAIRVNAFSSDDTPNSQQARNGTHLFHLGSMTSHSCTPNAQWVIQINSEIHLRASIGIKKGEIISQLYAQPTLGTYERRKLLRAHHFECSCERCIDPTELNTNLSSVKCNCGNGFLSAISPLEDPSIWACNTCSEQTQYGAIEGKLNYLKNKKNCVVGEDDSVGSLKKLIEIVEEGKNLFHENHYLIHGMENEIIQRISYLFAASLIPQYHVKVDLAHRLVQLCRKSMKMADVIWPGMNRHRGRLMYFLQQGLIIIMSQQMEKWKNEKNKRNEEGEKIKESLDEILQLRSECLKILNFEPEGKDEAFIAKSLSSQPKEILNAQSFLTSLSKGSKK